MVGHAAMLGVQAFSNLTTPPDLFGPTGHLIAILGLFGLYPVLVDRTPTVARVAGAIAAVAFASWAVMVVTRFLEAAGVVSTVNDVLPGAFLMLVFASTILTYILSGIAILRVDSDSRLVGLLVLAPGALILVALIGSTVANVTAIVGFVIGGGQALSMLGLGHILRTWESPAGGATPAGEVTAG